MIYQSIAELLNTTENMTVIRNNVRQDDGTDTIAGVDWFLFRDVIASNLYVNGNGWINFGRNAEGGLKVNRRDQACWYLWREVGSIRNEGNRFLRVRWRGYSQYNTTAEGNLLIFDVVLCDTGDIILKIDTWPTANIDGANRLEANNTVNFTPRQSAKEFSFIHQDAHGNNFALEDGITEVFQPNYIVAYNSSNGYGEMKNERVYCGVETALTACTFTKTDYTFIGWDTNEAATTVVYTDGQSVTDIAAEDETITLYAVWRKSWAWLIGDAGGNIYTVTRSGSAQTREQLAVSSLTAEVFYTHGFQFTPASDVLTDLTSPRIWKWNDSVNPSLTAEVEAVPIVPQLVIFDTITLGSTVKYVNISGDDNSLWNVSFDDGNNWYRHNGSSWVRVTANGDGCLKRKLEILTAADWAEKVNGTLKFRVWLVADSWVKRIRVDY